MIHLIILKNEAVKPSVFHVATLGPRGTSSEYAAQSFIHTSIPSVPIDNHVHLMATFEECMVPVLEGSIHYAIVPHAYEGIHNFYMHPDLELFQLFRCDTPMYGLAVRSDFDFEDILLESHTIVSHPAPISLLKYYTGKEAVFKEVRSTSIAAELVREKVYDLAITNEIAREQNQLKFMYTFKSIPMSWSVFGRRESN
ncbi:bacilysin biosynthesis protein BacA [Bacillus cereus]|uniref:bacilysin biosynthesis protein BacA n=1 Tax=Bacillus cereus TaxID=1396 RepID=UPI000BEB7768|nr:bacilysin biosynthesis protein BacA [Bacillus cereus]PEF67960.1 bacilysin biosynthesis protein BacA [Bacillus cereus]